MTKISLLVQALQASLAALVLLSVVHLTDVQLAGIIGAVSLVLGAAVAIFDPRIPWGVTAKPEPTPSDPPLP